MTWAEENLDCAGLCTPIDYYIFSDVNEGLPETDCRTRFREWGGSTLVSMAGVISLAIGWMLVVFVISACLCYVRDPRREVDNDDLKDSFYDEKSD